MKRAFRRKQVGALAAIAAMAAAGAAFSAPARAVAPDPNPWLDRHFLNMAHQGGEDEAPSNTLFAFKSAIRDRGADTLELDVNLTSDGHLVVIHDDTWKRTACLPALCPGPSSSTEEVRPDTELNDMTLAEVQALDGAYWFRPNSYSHDYSQPDSAYPYRGIRTGEEPAPAGYAPRDFRIPTLEEVLDAFPTIPINIEIKMVKTLQPGPGGNGCVTDNGDKYCDDPVASEPVADALAELLDNPDYAWRDDIIVVSFSDPLIERFHAADDPPYVALAPGVGDTFVSVLDQSNSINPNPDVAAFQVPPGDSGFPGLDVPAQLLAPAPNGRDMHARGYAVHVWPNGSEPESMASYDRLYKLGIDGYMASRPSELHSYLCAHEIPRPDGSDRCPNPPAATPKAKKCKKGKKLKKGKCVKKKGKKRKKKGK